MFLYSEKELKKLVNEWLGTLDDIKEYWDGVYISDREMAKSWFDDFFEWLDKKNESN
jgi:hypothetical protein